MVTALKLETGKEMEAGLVAFQNEKNYFKFVVQQRKENCFLSLSSASDGILNHKLRDYHEGDFVYLRILAKGKEYSFEYSLNNENWILFGDKQNGKNLSTSVAGGFVGTYFGLYSYAQTPASATFDWVTYKALTE